MFNCCILNMCSKRNWGNKKDKYSELRPLIFVNRGVFFKVSQNVLSLINKTYIDLLFCKFYFYWYNCCKPFIYFCYIVISNSVVKLDIFYTSNYIWLASCHFILRNFIFYQNCTENGMGHLFMHISIPPILLWNQKYCWPKIM